MEKSKVAVVECDSYDSDKVYRSVKKGLGLLGGIEEFVDRKDKILVKPNLLSEGELVSPRPELFESIIRILEQNKCKKIFYGDSPGFGKGEKISQQNGLKKVAEKHGVEWADFDNSEKLVFDKARVQKEFSIAKGVLQADSIISLSKMKTHQLTGITGAVKNQYGFIYGFEKKSLHAKYPNASAFSKMLVDLNLIIKPRLFVMDGIVAMQGNGPRSGNSKKMNILLFSKDPVALDTVFCRLIGVKPEHIPTNVFGHKYGLGNMNNIEVVGDSIEKLKKKDFDAQKHSFMGKKYGLSRLMEPFLKKPIIDKEKCIKCGNCVKVCPVEGKAVDFKEKGKAPVFDYSKCIRCFTCQEICPAKAIKVKTPLLGKIFLYR